MVENPCPSCGKPMEKGYLIAEHFVEGVRFVKEKTRLGTGGDPIGKPDALANTYVAGFRCSACKLLLLFY